MDGTFLNLKKFNKGHLLKFIKESEILSQLELGKIFKVLFSSSFFFQTQTLKKRKKKKKHIS